MHGSSHCSRSLIIASFILLLALISENLIADDPARQPPNILLAIADDWGAHAGVYNTGWVRTPTFDRIASQGIVFRNAYTPMAKCATSRAILLTGRHLWQLKAAGNHLCYFPQEFKTWPEVLRDHGWHTGLTGKDWGPGIAVDSLGRKRQLCGTVMNQRQLKPAASGISRIDYYQNFCDFLEQAPQDRPWSFWFSSLEPHRGYEFQSGVSKNGRNLSDIDRVPGYWPDTPTIRHDMLDYAMEVEHFDAQLERMLQELDKRGLADNTIVLVTSDHGMPFPRVKGYVSRDSNRVPLAIRWPNGIQHPGRVVDDFVDFTDIAPTVLDMVGIDAEDCGMAPITGASIRDILESDQVGRIVPGRDHVLLGKERTDLGRPQNQGYPVRGLLREQSLLLLNAEPDRWPAGNPETGYLDTDGSPTKTAVLQLGRRNRSDRFWTLNFGKRPAVEFYDLKNDPDGIENLANVPAYQSTIQEMTEFLTGRLRTQGDPRVLGNEDYFDSFPPTQGDGYYEKYMRGEASTAGWVNPDDYEKSRLEE